MRDELGRLQEQVDAANTREEKLRRALAEAEGEREAAILARRDLLVSGDLNDTKAQTLTDRRVSDAERKVAALSDAINVTCKQRQAAEQELAQGRDRAARQKEAEWALNTAEHITKAMIAYEQAAQPLAVALRQVRSFHGNQLALYVERSKAELREHNVTGVGALVRDLKIYSADLLADRSDIQKKLPLEDAKVA